MPARWGADARDHSGRSPPDQRGPGRLLV